MSAVCSSREQDLSSPRQVAAVRERHASFEVDAASLWLRFLAVLLGLPEVPQEPARFISPPTRESRSFCFIEQFHRRRRALASELQFERLIFNPRSNFFSLLSN